MCVCDLPPLAQRATRTKFLSLSATGSSFSRLAGWFSHACVRACVRLIRTWLYCQRLCIADYQTCGRTAAAGGVWTFDIPHPPSFPGGTCRNSILPLCVGRRGTLTRGIYLLPTYSQLVANSSGFGERDWARVVECRSEIPRVSLYLVPWGGRIAAFCFLGLPSTKSGRGTVWGRDFDRVSL